MTGGKRALALLRWLRDLPGSVIGTADFSLGVAIILRMDAATGWSRTSVRRLALDAKLSRSAGYEALRRLIERGLVLRRGRRGRSPWLCINPSLFIDRAVHHVDDHLRVMDTPIRVTDKVVPRGGQSSP